MQSSACPQMLNAVYVSPPGPDASLTFSPWPSTSISLHSPVQSHPVPHEHRENMEQKLNSLLRGLFQVQISTLPPIGGLVEANSASRQWLGKLPMSTCTLTVLDIRL